MRIIAGKYKGRQVLFPRHIRPTQDKIRQAIFNILGQDLKNLVVLDLFAGSGAFGLEALSRGAKNVVFVDIERKCNLFIGRNLENLRVSAVDAEIYRQDVFHAITVAAKRKRRFDVIFADPPYHKDLAKKLLKISGLGDILRTRGLLVIEHARSDELGFEPQMSAFKLYKEADYGKIRVSFFVKGMVGKITPCQYARKFCPGRPGQNLRRPEKFVEFPGFNPWNLSDS